MKTMPGEKQTRKRRFTVGIAGSSGAGKTAIAKALVEYLAPERISYIPYDAYYRDQSAIPEEERELINFDHPRILDTSLLVEHIVQLQCGYPIDIPVYDFATHTRTGQNQHVSPGSLILVEGLHVLVSAEVRSLLDYSVFVYTDLDVCLIRRLNRDVVERGRSPESVMSQWQYSVRPIYKEYIEPSKQFAQIIVNGEGPIDDIVPHLADRLLAFRRNSSGCSQPLSGRRMMLDSKEIDDLIVAEASG